MLVMFLNFCLTEKTPDAKARRSGFAVRQIPDELRQAIVGATAFDPVQRYASTAALGCAFDEAICMAATCAPAPVRLEVLPSSPSAVPVRVSASVADRPRLRIPSEAGVV